MDTPALIEIFGKVAGIAGLGIAVCLLIFRDVIAKNIFPTLNRVHAYRLLRLIIVLTFLLGVAGVGASMWANTRAAPNSGVQKMLQSDQETSWAFKARAGQRVQIEKLNCPATLEVRTAQSASPLLYEIPAGKDEMPIAGNTGQVVDVIVRIPDKPDPPLPEKYKQVCHGMFTLK